MNKEDITDEMLRKWFYKNDSGNVEHIFKYDKENNRMCLYVIDKDINQVVSGVFVFYPKGGIQ